ncbi:hypothetical protein [Selenomonas sp. TAMA-11512]|uniref:hypothetical protein n=1 Tax=Selenomonas sp. TAMA-11512 TaxID=3095337 RepID=UPI0030CEBC9D
MKMTFDEDNEEQLDDTSSLSVTAYYAAGMADDEITALQKKRMIRQGHTFTYRAYCASAERTIIKRLVFNGTDSSATIFATRN